MLEKPSYYVGSKDGDSFFVSWSDLQSLLLVLFAYIISISTVDQIKLAKATESMNTSLGQVILGEELDTTTIDQLYQEIIKLVKENGLEGDFDVIKQRQKIFMNLGQNLLFTSGSIELKPQAEEILQQLAKILNKQDIHVLVEGHSDNVPIVHEIIKSNWHLSAARSSEVVYFLRKSGMVECFAEVVSYGSERPILPNDTEKNRQRNRRVAIFVMPKNMR